MSGRVKRGPGRPRNSETQQTLSPYPSSPLTPESEEGFMMGTREEGRSGRVRNRPKPQPAKKTRVNAQSKLKSPIKTALIGSCTESNRENHDLGLDHSNLMEVSPYAVSQPLYDHFVTESLSVIKQPTDPDDELAKNKVCAFCNCGVEKRMFHGKLQRYAPTAGFNPHKKLHNRHRQNSGSDMLRDRLDLDLADPGHCAEDHPEPQPIVTRRGPGRPPGRGRRKGIVVVGLPLRTNNHEVIVDKITYGTVREKDVREVFDEDGYIWAHHCCAAWSEGVCQTDSYDLINVDKAVVNAMSERCNHCNRFGASVVCQIPRCGKIYHYPCAASSGSFQDIKSMTMLCPDHLEDAGRLAASEAECVLCGVPKDFAEMIFCTSCGRHYHGHCLEPSVDLTSLVRMGWQCPDCKVCQGCRQPGDDNRMLVCDLCDTGFHTYCLDPPMTTIPKTGWKCLGCRRCEDCGSNTPGGGPTSRWHHNFSVCDSCYQQRNKGLFCPLCGKAYRQFTDVAMVQCLSCEKWVHASCDNINKDEYQRLNAKDLPYYCPNCKLQRKGCHPMFDKNHCDLGFDERLSDVDMTLSHPLEEDKRTLTMVGRVSPCNTDEDLSLLNSHLDKDLDDMNPLRHFDSVLADVTDTETIPMPNLDNIEAEKLPLSEKLPLDEEMEVVVKPDHELDLLSTPGSLSESCPLPSFATANQLLDRHLVVPKLTSPSFFPSNSSFVTPPKISGKRKMTGKVKSKTTGTPAKKKSKHGKPGRPPSKLKNKGVVQSSPGKENLASTANTINQINKEEESDSLHTTVVLFSADDEFTTKQDMCLCCGSFGKGPEGQLIMCSQCGQSYHPYCVGVKVNKVILTKGWRCLDCTLCEGCGKGSDEARLLLCDSCDISYHTYCLDPPLDHVPQGGWKCKWCVTCFDCGATTPGTGCEWMSNYTQCGPCASKTMCPVCRIKYNANDLMIQCAHCDRWLHGSCDGLMSEEELDRAADFGYHCLFCRPLTKRTLVGVSGMSSTPSASHPLSLFFSSAGTNTLQGPPSPKATALHHYHPQVTSESSIQQPPGKPLHPCQRVNNNLVELKLTSHFNKMQMTAPSAADSVQLTEWGVLHMNRLKLPSGNSRKRVIKRKIKPIKSGSPVSPLKKNSFASQLQEKDAAFTRALMEATNINPNNNQGQKTAAVNSKVNQPRQTVLGRPGVGGFVLHGRGSGGRRFVGRGVRATIKRKGPITARGLSQFSIQGNPSPQHAFTSGASCPTLNANQPSFSQVETAADQGSNDSWASRDSTANSNPLDESYPKWMLEAFFGKDLLDSMVGAKGSKHGGQTPSTPSEDDERTNQDPFTRGTMPCQRQETPVVDLEQGPYQLMQGQIRDASQQPSQSEHNTALSRSSNSSLRKHPPDLGLSGHENWHQPGGSDPLPPNALSLTEEYPNPDALYRTLGMMADDQSGVQPEPPASRGLTQSVPAQHHGTALSSQPQVSQNPITPATSSWNQPPPRSQGSDLDILCNTGDILPHVDGHEVEEIFAGIEREMNNRESFGFLDSELENNVPNAQGQFTHPRQQLPQQGTVPPTRHTVTFQSGQPSLGGYAQETSNQPYNYQGQHFDVLPAGAGSLQGHNFPGGSEGRPQHPMNSFPNSVVPGQLGFGQEGTFPRTREFDLDDSPRERRRPPSPRVDPLKQQQKWEEDEKLGAMATISPVLYANLEHVNLKQEYPDWPNRYRAIARLWRKLSVEQRDPYRLKARDNRVRLKDQGKKLIPKSEDKVKAESQKPQQQNQQPPQPVKDLQKGQLQTPSPVQPAADNQVLPRVTTPVTTGLVTPLTPSTPVRSVTPVTPGTPAPLTPTTPTTPTLTHGSIMGHSPMGPVMPVALASLPASGKTVSSKGKKTKEEKEREKEIRKQRLRIQQEQERQWKILQQKRALEQQRQQQQQQQEHVLLRQELKKQQQAKGTKGVDDQKKKRLPKGGKRVVKEPEQSTDQPTSAGDLQGDNVQRGRGNDTYSTNSSERKAEANGASPSGALEGSANSIPFKEQMENPSSAGLFKHFSQGQEDHSSIGSKQQLQNLHQEEYHRMQANSIQHLQGPGDWNRSSVSEQSLQHSEESLWEQRQECSQMELEQDNHPSVNSNGSHIQHTHEITRQSPWHREEPKVMQSESLSNHLGTEDLQESRSSLHESRHVEQPQVGFNSHDHTIFQDQSWMHRPHPHPQGMSMSHPSVPGEHLGAENGQMVQHLPATETRLDVPFSAPQDVSMSSQQSHNQQPPMEMQHNPQQPSVFHWQQELSQVQAQVAGTKEVAHPQSVPPAPPPPPPPPPPAPAPPSLPPLAPTLPSTQQQHGAPPQNFELSGAWPQQNQVQPSVQQQPMVSLTQPSHQMHISSHSQPTMPQIPFQPLQQLPAQMVPASQPNTPMASQPQESQLQQQQQQLDLAQRQQREQLVRAQHQQLIQIQLQQQQVLQQQQQQQNTTIQPPFARGRFNQVINTKDMPEIESEEEHQERLRFLYRQRQVQKQQQMQIKAQLIQQAWIQQQFVGNGQAVVPPALLTMDPSNPQILQQFAQQMRPQIPDLTQQQLLAEYQRRLQQRQDLGQQTIQYEKVVQEFQQQQGIQAGGGGAPAGSAFVEVPHQRFALRPSTPGVQPALRPIMPYGIDGQFVGQQQQLYKIQLQQQIMMQQHQKGSPQKSMLHSNLLSGKPDTHKRTSEAGHDGGNQMLGGPVTPSRNVSAASVEKNCSIDQGGAEPQGAGNGDRDEQGNYLGNLCNSVTKDIIIKNELVAPEPYEEGRENNHGNWSKDPGNDRHRTVRGSAECKVGNHLDGEEQSTNNGEGPQKLCEELIQGNKEDNSKDGLEHSKNVMLHGKGSTVLLEGSYQRGCVKRLDKAANLGTSLDAEKDLCVTSVHSICAQNTGSCKSINSAECKLGSEKDCGSTIEKQVCCELPSLEQANTQVWEKGDNGSSDIEGKSDKKEVSQHQETKTASRTESVNDINHCPTQPQPLASQVLPGPQTQQMLFQQQLMGLQQQFLQMQQQRHVLVQQYQQLQQQLQQAGGQEPVLAAQVMNVQHQGQILQQQMLQAWQQMQLIQQQLQLAGAPNQQQITLQQQHQQQQMMQQQLGQQWPQGVLHEQQIGAQTGVYPVRPGTVSMPAMTPSGVTGPIKPAVTTTEKNQTKPKRGKPRKKSDDLSTSQPSPIGQQNLGVEWQPPKTKQVKARHRKTKKPDTKVDDPNLELQQQRLQQQLFQQLEQRHRLMQQQQGAIAETETQHGQQLSQQHPASLQHPKLEEIRPLAPQHGESIHPIPSLPHTPELGQAPPLNTDSQMGPPGVPQIPHPSSQAPAGYPQSTEPGSFSQRFPTPEHYLQQFSQRQVQQRQAPTVQYVAEANNPFSDEFQGLQSKGRGRGLKKKSAPKKPGKPRAKKGVEPPPLCHEPVQQHQQRQADVGNWFSPTQQAEAQKVIKQEKLESQGALSEAFQTQPSANNTNCSPALTLGSPNVSLEDDVTPVFQSEPPIHNLQTDQSAIICSVASMSETNDLNALPTPTPNGKIEGILDNQSAPPKTISPALSEGDVDTSVLEKEKGSRSGPGLGAPLQKLESMVADIASEEEACKELEKQNEIERLELQVDEDESDLDMDKLLFEEPTFEQDLLSPRKSMGDGSQANSEVSLECHEDSLISPLLEEPERRRDRQKFFGEGLSNERLAKDTRVIGTPRVEDCKAASGNEEQSKEKPLPLQNDTAGSSGGKQGDPHGSCHDPVDGHTKGIQAPCQDKPEEPKEDLTSWKSFEKLVEPQSGDVMTPMPISSTGVTCHQETVASTCSPGKVQTNSSDSSQLEKDTISTSVMFSETVSQCEHGYVPNPPAHVPEREPQSSKFDSIKNSPVTEICEPCAEPDVSATASSVCRDTVANEAAKTSEGSRGNSSEAPKPVHKSRAPPREKTVKTSKQTSRVKNQHHSLELPLKKKSPVGKEEDPIKKHLQDLRRQEYERKKREYEEQQRRKRELQKELRIQKQIIKEQRKRQRIYMTNNRSKQKPEVTNESPAIKVANPNNTCRDLKPGTPLSLCEPKLILTHALIHPYGSRPFSGQCPLEGNFGSAKVDGMVDYYSQFPSPDVDLVGHPPTPPSSLPPSPEDHQRRTDATGKPLVNGDLSLEQKAELLTMNKTRPRHEEVEHRVKRARFIHGQESSRWGVSIPPSMPTPPLSDSAAATNDRVAGMISSGNQRSDAPGESNGKDSSATSSSSSPETVQYIASSSPESDALNRAQAPKFPGLLDRERTDSPTFSAVTIKREHVEHFLENGLSQSCRTPFRNDAGKVLSRIGNEVDAYRASTVDNNSDDLDSISVTLTLSPTSEKRVTDTVASVADLIGCSPPRRSDIIIEPAMKPLSSQQYPSAAAPTEGKLGPALSGSSLVPRSRTTSDLYQKTPCASSQFSTSSNGEALSRKKPDGPYCRHCDVLIIGIGVMRRLDQEQPTDKKRATADLKRDGPADDVDYKIYRVNVEAGDSAGDMFCSEDCVKQYFAHFGSECSSPLREPKTEHGAVRLRYDSSVISLGQTSVGAGNVTTISGVDSRGSAVADGMLPTSLRKIRSPSWRDEDEDEEMKGCKRQRRLRWKRWQQSDAAKGDNKHRHELTVEEIAELLHRLRGDVKPSSMPADTRLCTLCAEAGDGDTDVSARLLNLDVDVWVHLNCALWSLEVYETLNGALMNVELAVKRGIVTKCVVCNKKGATVTCNQKIGLSKIGCTNNFHFGCAITHDCVFFKDKTMLCHEHRPRVQDINDLVLSSYAVYRKVYVNRDEIQQIASMLRHNQETNDKPQTLRVGSLVVKSLGQLLPHQLQSFHTRDAVYPVGFKTIRFYWSMRSVNRRCKYHCVVDELEGTPSFTIKVDEEGHSEQLVFRGKTPRDVWRQILDPIGKSRKAAGLVNLFPQYITGEDLFGLSEQFVLRIIESMPGVDQMQGYNMRYGPSPVMELPLAVNPTGSARSEPLLKTHFRSTRARALRSASGLVASPTATASSAGTSDESSGLYLKQFVYSKATQYRKLKTEWKSNVFLGRSNIQGLGLFANKDMEGGSMVIEYIGSIIRNEVANRREQVYEKQNRGVYMFRIDSDSVIDATMAGGPARYINHSCMPNCVAEVVTFEKEQKIIIISNRKVEKGEELTYDYKFDFEDEENKIPCLCGAPNCRKWMN